MHVRLDIYVKDVSGKVYDIEMQNSSKREYSLAKRARYYQSVIDTEELKEGKHYDELPESYIIFICAFDEFGLAKSKYSFSYRCNETPELLLQNGANVVILNTRGTEDTDVDKDIAVFLGYVESSSQKVAQNSGSEFLRYVHERFEHVKKEKRGDFMTLQEYLDDEIAERVEEAVAEAAEEAAKAAAEKAAKEAAEEVKLKMAANMRKEGFDPAVIARITGLTEEAFSG